MARTKKRREAELRYCFDCFDWHVEEYWNKHCQMHIDHIRSRRCGSIVYCNTLVRPSCCPFCIGNPQLLAGKRWETWTRDTKMRAHLDDHMDRSRWPLKCPHPLCEAEEGFSNRLLFLYHLDDAHDLDTRQMQDDCWQAKVVKPMSVIGCTRNVAGRKRKEPDGFGAAPWPPAQHENHRKVAKITNNSALPSVTTVSPASLQLSASEHPEELVLVDTPFTTTAVEDAEAPAAERGKPREPFRRLEQTQAQTVDPKALSPKLQPSIDLDDEASLRQPLELSATILSPKLELPDLNPDVSFINISTGDGPHHLPELTHSGPMSPLDTDHLSLLDDVNPGQTIQNKDLRDEDSVFSQYLRSRSPSDSSTKGFGDKDGSLHSHTVTPSKPENIPVKTNKPCITLRIRPPKSEPKPKVLLRLSQPKPAPAQRSVRQEIKNRRRRRT